MEPLWSWCAALCSAGCAGGCSAGCIACGFTPLPLDEVIGAKGASIASAVSSGAAAGSASGI
ncbi:hypothetical protein X928_04455 [Petrotoga miotherma DSM 10691]|jgi:hypothetical protein|uniref:Uncharacterized protein n=1 Tax=Petrotoga miotherma DSM 10691 TaxID=1434326 RepID=A0A2K1PD45_9BACT|nr:MULTISPECIES: hypothetical protein [Petrotoga]MDK2906694.1 hypothetical protein [Petrotoga sp.]PNS00706.1 hypothetical protein X928_04455 [Petrotoga miotherma DSM 10691]